ncbi:MAG: ParE family toxin-like protein [Gammaproteobacteria bacterium]
MKHCTSSHFWELYRKLPSEIRELADKNYELLKENPRHPSLQLKRIEELWSVRIGHHYRAIGIDVPSGIQWIWIGTHADYDKFIT